MAYLNLKKEGIEVAVDFSRRERTDVRVGEISEDTKSKLREGLSAVASGEEAELRVDFAENFTLFIKARSDVSRMLIAHPEKDLWVGTIALTKEHTEALSSALTASAGASAFSVEALGRVDKVGNLGLTFS